MPTPTPVAPVSVEKPTITLETTTIQVTTTEPEEPTKPKEEPNLIPSDNLGFAPIVDQPYHPNVKDLQKEVSSSEVKLQSNLFQDAPPIMPVMTPVRKKAQVKTNIDVQNKEMANVKSARPGIIELLFSGKKSKPQVKPSVPQDPVSTPSGEDDIPDFFRR